MGASVAILLALAAAADPCVRVADGRQTRTCFDPGERFELSAGGRLGAGSDWALGGGARLSGALRLRTSRTSRRDGQPWSRDHTLGEAEVELPRLATAAARFEGVAYRGVFVRRYEEGALVLQGLGWRIPFPFDVGLGFESLRFAYDRSEPDLARLELLRLAPLLDANRRVPGAWRFAFGPEVAWALRVSRSGEVRHLVQPFSGGLLDLRFETADGLLVASAQGRAGWELDVGAAAGLRWSAALDVERTLLAIDDRPLAPYLRVEAAGETRPGGVPVRVTGEIGLRLAAPL